MITRTYRLFDRYRFAPKKVNAPKAVFCVTKEVEPRRATATGFWTIVFGQYASDDMLINLDTKSFRDDQGDPRAAKALIAAFELDNGEDEWFGWPLRPWFRCFSGREQSTVLALHQVLVKLR